MAHSYNENVITREYHGKFGNGVFRSYGGMSVLSPLPNCKGRVWSPAQKAVRIRFGASMTNTRKIFEDQEVKAYYQSRVKRAQTAWNVAVADYMKKPVVDKIDINNYHGKKGDTIYVRAHDNYCVAAVIVTILSAVGLEIETGLAVRFDGRWVYQAMEDNARWRGGRILVRVYDRPGNVGKGERVVGSP